MFNVRLVITALILLVIGAGAARGKIEAPLSGTRGFTPPDAAAFPMPTGTLGWETSREPVGTIEPSFRTPDVHVSESTVTFKSYPFQGFLEKRIDPSHNFEYLALNREQFDAAVAAQGTGEKSYRAVVLENQYLRLTFLPELGGRLYQITYKPTNQNLLYNNQVLKPTPWGPAQQGGWLAVGGMEWALPVNEHGYEWGVPWEYFVTQHADGATVTLVDSRATNRVRARIDVTLPREGAYVIVKPRIENPTAAPQRIQFWVNAMLALGSPTVSPKTQFYFPTDSVLVHSTADQFIPPENIPADDATAPRAPLSFKNAGGQDLSWYANWENYLGVFADNLVASQLAQTFVGAYNYDTRFGVARVFPPQNAPGVKLFAFGHDFCCKDAFADDGSTYFELWGGLPRTFFADDDVTLAPGQAREWTEYWMPVANTDGISAAAPTAVLSLASQNGVIQVSAYSAVSRNAVLVLSRNGQELKRWNLALTPAQTFSERVPTDATGLQLGLLDPIGNLILKTP